MDTDDQLIEAMARVMFGPDQLNRLDIVKAALAVARPIIEAQERERCAKIAEEFEPDAKDYGPDVVHHIAAAIRSDGDE